MKWCRAVLAASEGAHSKASMDTPQVGFNEFEKQLKGVAESGTMTARSAMGQKFRDQLGRHATLKANYDACVGRDSKAAFRVQWARQEWTKVKETREESRCEKFSEFAQCKYRPLTVVFQKEGGDQDALVATRTLVGKCQLMGFPFIRVSPWTDRHLFLLWLYLVCKMYTTCTCMYIHVYACTCKNMHKLHVFSTCKFAIRMASGSPDLLEYEPKEAK